MYQLEHMAVALALHSASVSTLGTIWRQRQYGRVIKLLSVVEEGSRFSEQITSVAKSMWTGKNRPVANAKNKVYLDHGYAVDKLAEAALYKSKMVLAGEPFPHLTVLDYSSGPPDHSYVVATLSCTRCIALCV